MPAARLLELTRESPAHAGPGRIPPRPAPARSQKERRQQRLGGGKENSLGVVQPATAAAHMPAESEIVTFLREAGLTKYCPMFLREEIDLAGAALRQQRSAPLRLPRLWPHVTDTPPCAALPVLSSAAPFKRR